MTLNTIHNQDCIIGMQTIPDQSIDCILTDPPYKYLKNQKLEVDFDETAFFAQAKRVLKKDGFIVLFGRGTSFYRWNTMLADMGFTFKEEIVWDKVYNSSPMTSVSRRHETISIHTKGKNSINKVRIPYSETKQFDLSGMIADIKRLIPLLRNPPRLAEVVKSIESGCVKYEGTRLPSITCGNKNGISIVEAGVMVSIEKGMLEKSIITSPYDKYKRIHPTQKPARLLERLLALVTKEGDTVLDPFSGSGATAVACVNSARKFIGYEIDAEYHQASIARLTNHTQQMKLDIS